jgi:hypothetical protein
VREQLPGCWQGNQQLSDAALGHCARLQSLQHLETSNCWHLTDSGLIRLTQLTALAHLDLSYCWQVLILCILTILVHSSACSIVSQWWRY